MSDNKLKIRIHIQQPNTNEDVDETQAIEHDAHDATDFDTQTQLEKPPFDWRKITVALLLLFIVIVTLGYYLLSQKNDKAETGALDSETASTPHETSESAHEQVPTDQSATEEIPQVTPDKSSIVIPDSKPHYIKKPDVPQPEIKPEFEAAPQQNTEQPLSDDTASPVLINQDTTDHNQVIRAQLTHLVKRREPVDNIEQIRLEHSISQSIYFFVELYDLAGQHVTVSWYFNDQPTAKTRLRVGGKNWRTYANKLLNKRSIGQWRVTLTDDTGELLAERHFTVSDHM